MSGTLKRLFSLRSLAVLGGLAVLAVVAGTLAPLVSVGGMEPFAGWPGQILVAGFLPGVYVVMRLLDRWLEFRRNAETLDAAITGGRGAIAPTGQASADQEAAVLAERMKEALAVLKKRRFSGSSGRRWLYQLPWYLIIGPPGAGKTTALVNSGINFPLSDRFGRNAVRGVGGTRGCDWWFTDEAVLIDTAGRYTTQDSDPEKDKATWLGFLRLLRRHRRRQPLNGLLVAIAIDALTEGGEAARVEHAQRIRQRIQEIQTELQITLPVYLLLTKADLISGFVEFFDDLGREGRQAVWGFTFDRAADAEIPPADRFGIEFDTLLGRLDERLTERLQQEGDIERRAILYGFPQQVASLRDPFERFVQEAFHGNSFEPAIMLRGAYFVSGTQAGTPIDRVVAAMTRTFGIGRPGSIAPSHPKRSYFLNRLLREVVFGEAGLVDADPRLDRRRRRLAWLVYGIAATVCLTVPGLWGVSYLVNRNLIETVEAAAASYTEKAKAVAPERASGSDIRRAVPVLNELRDLPTGYGGRDLPRPWYASFGLDQSGKLNAQAVDAYRRILGSVLLPGLVLRLEEQLRAQRDNPEFLYQALKMYLMLGNQGPMDRAFAARWFELDTKAAFPDQGDAPLRKDIAGHVQALLERPLPSIALDGELIQDLREVLSRTSPAKRTLDAIVASPEAESLPSWTVADHAGPAGSWVFRRVSGQPLAQGIPGLYTRDGFFKMFLPLLPRQVALLREESWVLGEEIARVDAEAGDTIERDVVGLYLQAFALHWDRLLNDVVVSPVNSQESALRTLSVLASPTSPARLLVVAASRETKLAPPREAEPDGAGQERLASLLGQQKNPDSITALAERFTAEHFRELHALSAVPPGSAANAQPPIDDVIASLGALYRSLSQAGLSGGQGGALQGSVDGAAALAEIEIQAARLPSPVRQWIAGISKVSSDMSTQDVRRRLMNAWMGHGGQLCAKAIAGRYPFDRSSGSDIPLEDFARVFATGGLFDSFFERNLLPFVDRSSEPWRWRKVGSVDLKLSSEALAQFERAARIRDSLFLPGGAKPEFAFRVSLLQTDPGSSGVEIGIGGQTAVLAPGEGRPATLNWPGSAAEVGMTVSFRPAVPSNTPVAGASGGNAPSLSAPGSNAPGDVAADGVWGLFRLLDRGVMRPSGASDAIVVRVGGGGRWADLLLQGSTLGNPFAPGLLSNARCPTTI
ncbi:type VI secretion system membrane subunit TssM [Arenibaculum pallidiluteum]|uniref:type VI secretion system membrane subunit TssM n=1 Tax=Arenibaculum pallidiluteum TaxID=2812559 RepID=UPI001A96C56E|nr:type VI secretion system membrane subunit TssM [Arenibaculum pallidiluteum]